MEGLLKNKNGSSVLLRIHDDMAFLPLATSFVEKAALAYGLADPEAMALTLATEEIFAYLCRAAGPDGRLELRCSSGKYFVQTDFHCPLEDLDMRFFNVTATVSVEDEASLDQMGLLIASRFVDRLHVQEGPGRGILLTLIKEKSYPALEEIPAPSDQPPGRFTVKRPDPAALKIFVQSVHAYYPAWLIPPAFRFPGKVVDMVSGGEYDAALAMGAGGGIRGGMVWHWMSEKMVECFGPYLLGQDPDSPMPEALLEACIGAIAKTPAVGLVNAYATEQLPREHFEVLGTLTRHDPAGPVRPVTAYFRQMQEDPGTTSWCHPEVEDFLRGEYRRLVLPREVHRVKNVGEQKNPYSVLSAEFRRPQSSVILRPIRSGKDAQENLIEHLRLFSRESLPNVYFEMDLGLAWQSDFTPGLLRNGFTPRMVIPYGGEGDTLVFQLGSVEA